MNNSAPNRGDETTVIVDHVSIGLPARRYDVRATIGYNAKVPLLVEFALRLIRICETVDVKRVRAYFGFTEREVNVLVDQLAQAELIQLDGDAVRLSRKAKGLFLGEDSDPRISVVDSFGRSVAFERVTMTPLGRAPYVPRTPRSVLRVPIVNKRRAADGIASVRESFRKNFREIASAYLPGRDNYERAYVYTVDDVLAKSTFLHEVDLPVEIRLSGEPSTAVNYEGLERGRVGSRDELLQAVSGAIQNAAVLPSDSVTLEVLSAFDNGIISSSGAVRTGALREIVQEFDLSTVDSELVRETQRFVGTVATDDVQALLIERTSPARFVDEQPAHVLWLRPPNTLWGRGSRWSSAMRSLRERWGDAVTTLVWSSAIRDDDMAHWFGPAKGTPSFNNGASVAGLFARAAVEVLLRPNRWAVVIAYVCGGPTSFPIPVGFYSENHTIVRAVQQAVRGEIGATANAVKLHWYPRSDAGPLHVHEQLLTSLD